MLAIIIIFFNRYIVYRKWIQSKVLPNLAQILLSGSLIAQLSTLPPAGHNLPSHHLEPPSLNMPPILKPPCFADANHRAQEALMLPCQ